MYFLYISMIVEIRSFFMPGHWKYQRAPGWVRHIKHEKRLRISNSRGAIGVDTKLTFSLVDNLILWASCRFCQNLAKSGQIRELNLNDRRVSGILERKTTFWGVLGWGRHKLQHHKSREILTYTYTWYSTYLRCYGSDMAMASETWRYVAIKKLYINGLFQSSWKVIFPWDKTYFL